MKKLIIPFFLAIGHFLMAQMPHAFKYQGLARDNNFEILSNHALSLKASILADGPNGTMLYSEQHDIETTQAGLFSVSIGQGVVGHGSFKSIPWSDGTFYLQIDIDVHGQGSYEYAGTSPLLAVPFAMHARTADFVDDADADPANELQVLTFDEESNRLSISNGNAVQLPVAGQDGDADPSNEIQTLTRSGQFIQLSNGGEVVDLVEDNDADPNNEIQTLSRSGDKIQLSGGGEVVDKVNDADADPTNEIQTLSYDAINQKIKISNGNEIQINSGSDGDNDPRNELQSLSLKRQNKLEAPYQLSLSNGNKVDLPLMSLWRHSVQNNKISQIYTHTPVTTKSFTTELLEVTRRPAPWDYPRVTQTEYQFRTAFGATGMRMSKHRLAHHYQEGGSKYTMFLDDKSLRFYNKSEWKTAEFGGHQSGVIKLYAGTHATPFFEVVKTNSSRSQMRMFSPQSRQVIFGLQESSLGGATATWYGKKSVNVSLGNSGSADHGGLHVHNNKSQAQAGMYVDNQGRGVLYADIKNFVVEHPEDDTKQIVYASIEGPEAGIYERGTATLIEGKVDIQFSDHFALLLEAGQMTIQLTPLSADSKGLAVTSKLAHGFTVEELSNGAGNYSFDWEVKAVRKGYENFEVVREK